MSSFFNRWKKPQRLSWFSKLLFWKVLFGSFWCQTSWNSTWRVCQTSFFIAMYDDFEHRLKSVSTPFTTHFPAGKTSHWATLDFQGNILFGGVKGFKWSIFHLYFVKLHQVGHLPLLVWTSTPPFQRVTWWCHLRRNARRAASRLTVKKHWENLRKKDTTGTVSKHSYLLTLARPTYGHLSHMTHLERKKKHEFVDCWWIFRIHVLFTSF